MRRRMSRVLATVGKGFYRETRAETRKGLGVETTLPLVDGGLKLGFEILVESGLGSNLGEERVLPGREELLHRLGGGDDLLGVDRVEDALLQTEENRDLKFDRHRAE